MSTFYLVLDPGHEHDASSERKAIQWYAAMILFGMLK